MRYQKNLVTLKSLNFVQETTIHTSKKTRSMPIFIPLVFPLEEGHGCETYPLLTGDGAVPNHEIHGTVGQRLRFRHKTLSTKINIKRSGSSQSQKEAKKQGKVKGRSGRRHGDDSCARTSAPPLACRELCLPTSFFRSPFLAVSSRRPNLPLPFPLPVSSTNIYLHAGYQNQKIKNVGPQQKNPKLHPNDPSHQYMTSLPIYWYQYKMGTKINIQFELERKCVPK